MCEKKCDAFRNFIIRIVMGTLSYMIIKRFFDLFIAFTVIQFLFLSLYAAEEKTQKHH